MAEETERWKIRRWNHIAQRSQHSNPNLQCLLNWEFQASPLKSWAYMLPQNPVHSLITGSISYSSLSTCRARTRHHPLSYSKSSWCFYCRNAVATLCLERFPGHCPPSALLTILSLAQASPSPTRHNPILRLPSPRGRCTYVLALITQLCNHLIYLWDNS